MPLTFEFDYICKSLKLAMEIYKAKKENYSVQLNTINKKYNSVSFLRLISIVLFLVSIYYYLKSSAIIYVALSVFLFIAFIVLMRIHSKLLFKKQVNQALFSINEDEITYLERKKIFENRRYCNQYR